MIPRICAALVLALVAGACSAESPTTAADDPGHQQVLDSARLSYGSPGALALVMRDGEVEWFGSSGSADVDGAPITVDTRFRVASITKPMIATLVMQAVLRGEVSLDDVVGDIVPGVLTESHAPITVRQILDHTSGVFDEGNEGDPTADIALLADPALQAEANALIAELESGGDGIASARLIVALAEVHDRYFEPGSGYHYSNPNYQLAGMVLEEVTGANLDEVFRTGIVEPLGLERTTLAPFDTTPADFRGYGTSVDDGSLVDISDDFFSFGNGGNGGVMSTAPELLQIIRAIVAGELLTPDATAFLLEPTYESGVTYGLGMVRFSNECGVFHGHEGGLNGTASIAMVSPDGRTGVVIAFNLRSGTDPALRRLAVRLLCG